MPNRKRWLIPGILLLVLAAAGGGWLYWVSTPRYAVYQIHRAVVNHDREAFERHVDIERVIGRATEAIIAAALRDPSAGSDVRDAVGRLGAELGVSLTGPLVRSGAAGISEAVLGAVAGGDVERERFEPLRDAGVFRGRFDGIRVRDRTGDQARMELAFHYPRVDTTLAVGLHMVWADGDWTVVEVDGLVAFLKALREAQVARLAEVNRPIRKEISTHLDLFDVEIDTSSAGDKTRVRARLEIANTADRPIRGIAVELIHPDDPAAPLLLEADAGLPPGETGIASGARVYDRSAPFYRAVVRRDARPEMHPSRLEIEEDGGWRVIETHGTWAEYLASLEGEE